MTIPGERVPKVRHRCLSGQCQTDCSDPRAQSFCTRRIAVSKSCTRWDRDHCSRWYRVQVHPLVPSVGAPERDGATSLYQVREERHKRASAERRLVTILQVKVSQSRALRELAVQMHLRFAGGFPNQGCDVSATSPLKFRTPDFVLSSPSLALTLGLHPTHYLGTLLHPFVPDQRMSESVPVSSATTPPVTGTGVSHPTVEEPILAHTPPIVQYINPPPPSGPPPLPMPRDQLAPQASTQSTASFAVAPLDRRPSYVRSAVFVPMSAHSCIWNRIGLTGKRSLPLDFTRVGRSASTPFVPLWPALT